MKVLVFTSLYPNNAWPSHGVFVKERMAHFARTTGAEVRVVAPVLYFPPIRLGHRWRYSQVARHEVIEGIAVHHPRYAMMPKVGMVWYGVLMFLGALRTVSRLRRSFDFDVIDAHYAYPDGFAAALLGRWFNKPVVVSVRGTDVNLYAGLPLIRRMLRFAFGRAAHVIAVCEALKRAVIELGVAESKVTVIPNGVDAAKFRPIPRLEARRMLGLPTDRRLVLSVGLLIPRKGFDLLIGALARLARRGQYGDVDLVIAGEGPERDALERLVAQDGLTGRVRLVGSVPHEALRAWYSAADLFCLTSHREGWPNVVMEALACGTPVVATAVWGTPEILRSPEIGFLTEADEGSIAAAIERALGTSWRAADIVAHMRSHTWERAALDVRDVLVAAIEGDAGAAPMQPCVTKTETV